MKTLRWRVTFEFLELLIKDENEEEKDSNEKSSTDPNHDNGEAQVLHHSFITWLLSTFNFTLSWHTWNQSK